MLTATAYFKEQVLANLVASVTEDDFAGILKPANVSVGLFEGTPGINQNVVLGDLTQPTWGGYALIPLTSWGAIRIAPNGDRTMSSNTVNFVCTGTPSGNVVSGAFLVQNDTTPDKLLALEMLDLAIPITQVGNGITYAVKIVLPFGWTIGEGCQC